MFKVISFGVLLAIGVWMSPAANAQNAMVDCESGTAHCEDACDGEKRWGLFKGKRFEECTVRCDEQLVKQCTARGNQAGESNSGGVHGDKIHPQGKQYGYEKNADRVKGQHGKAVSAEHRSADHEHDHEIQTKEEHEHEHAVKKQAEAAEKLKKEKAKGKNKDPEKSEDKEK